jgi:hypothetical protein
MSAAKCSAQCGQPIPAAMAEVVKVVEILAVVKTAVIKARIKAQWLIHMMAVHT